jgi:hypothetical protein
VDPVKAKVMYAVQQPLSWTALGDVMGVPAWKALPSWFLVADGDQTIPPDAERLFAKRMGATTVEVKTNHVAMVSHPDDVVKLIETAAQAVPVAHEAPRSCRRLRRSWCFACLDASVVDESRNARSCEPESLQDVEPRNVVPRLLPLCALIFLRRKIGKRGRRPFAHLRSPTGKPP